MIIVDTELQKLADAGTPLRVGIIGAGTMVRGIANQIINYTPGMRLAAILNRTPERAIGVFREAGLDDAVLTDKQSEFDDAIRSGRGAVTQDVDVLCGSDQIDVLLEATGHVDFGAIVTMKAIEAGKDIVLLNAEVDGTIGPLLKTKADKAGTLVSGCDGDQPAVQMNLYRFVKALGLRPLVCGNIKGMQDRYRTPETQAGFAKQWNMTPEMVTSFADGTKISFEQALVANATGMKVAQRGMIGIEHDGHIDEITGSYDIDQLRELGGIVDYALGSKPGPGVYVFAEAADETQAFYLKYGKLGDGPLYSFYIPYHLMVFEVVNSLARLALLKDVPIAPIAGQVVDVVTAAKRDLKAGETIDGLGGFMTYGLCENSDIVTRDKLLVMGIAEDCRLKRDVPKDQVLTVDDVDLPM
ncbi:MAG: NAD(P)-dependent oxidoreductase, partial [Gammaproteobacteria bacterium]|nr:NAD(P)-dependent oxidoreductase [Gammaproteobacteria bacterium]